ALRPCHLRDLRAVDDRAVRSQPLGEQHCPRGAHV
ncbi:MAG: hypothetical protein AVDCRST_MAG66-1109, partial [uncultured Pseudonocardia sp.]